MTTTVSDRFRIRRGTAADLATVNEVPLADEIVYESDQGTTDGRYKIKIGDGARHYNDLPYLAPSFPLDYISGLRLSYVDATHVQVGTGSAVIQSSGSLLEVATAISVAVTGTSQFLHLYLYDNAGTPAAESSTTAPATAYFGTARSKTGDTTRRYLGSVLTDASGNVIKFRHVLADSMIWYEVSILLAPFLVLSSGSATTSTTISCAGIVPVSGVTAHIDLFNAGDQVVYISNSDGPDPTVGYMQNSGANTRFMTDVLLDASQTYRYAYQAAPTGRSFHRVAGYRFQR